MEAELLLDRRDVLSEAAFIERVVWLLSQPLLGSGHRFKYRLALVVNGECVMRAWEEGYEFSGIDKLLADFRADVERIVK